MQRITLLVAALMLTLCLTNSYTAEDNQSESEDCWVIVKETYEWITDDEEMAAMHYVESNLTYDSECRLIERTDESYDSLDHDFKSYNEDGTISNTSSYMSYDGEIMYLWEDVYLYDDGILESKNQVEYSYNDGNYSVNNEWNTTYAYDGQGREILATSTSGGSSNEVATSYDENGNVKQVNTSMNGELRNTMEYTYSSDNQITTQTITHYYGSTFVAKTTNYSYDEEGKLVSQEQYDEPNNWTMYWNMTYDDNGNKITEEFHRVGNSPWSTLRTYTWSSVGDHGDDEYGEDCGEGTNDVDCNGIDDAFDDDDIGNDDDHDGHGDQTSQDADSDGSDTDDSGDQTNQDADAKSSGSKDETSSIMWIVILIVVLALGSVYLIYSNNKDDIVRKFTGIDKDEIVEEVLEQE